MDSMAWAKTVEMSENWTGRFPVHCLMCWEIKDPHGVISNPHWYCASCDEIQEAEARTYLRVALNCPVTNDLKYRIGDVVGLGDRWRDISVEYLCGPLDVPLPRPLTVGVIPVWRIRVFHARRRGYVEGWWTFPLRRWDVSLRAVDLDISMDELREWRRVMRLALRLAAGMGRPADTLAMTRDEFAAAFEEHLVNFPNDTKAVTATALGISVDTLDRYLERWPDVPRPERWQHRKRWRSK